MLWPTEDGLLLLGESDDVADMARTAPHLGQEVPASILGRIAAVIQGVEGLELQRGRWFKADAESAEWLAKNGVKNLGSGVVRIKDISGAPGNPGQIAKHLTVMPAGLLTPAAPAILAAAALQLSLQSSLDAMRMYLESMDQKLDDLLRQRKIETVGQLNGISWILQEAAELCEGTGQVTAMSWSTVQGTGLALATAQAECLGQLKDVAVRVGRHRGDTDALAGAIATGQQDVTFWLAVLGQAMKLQDQYHVLQLARITTQEPMELDDSRRAIATSRTKRGEQVVDAVRDISSTLQQLSDLSDLNRVANPLTSRRVTRAANAIASDLEKFVEYADLGVLGATFLEPPSWGGSAKKVLHKGVNRVEMAGTSMVGQAKTMTSRVRGRREQATLNRAEKIMARRQRALERTDNPSPDQDDAPAP
ncbi:hypothetical protein [Kocuria sp.]|uniref:hypothetical protein n=1 Tax=Kocuria sp. TaxID=1871328 RepID=UPI0026DB7232|nr:hypothetical protein [Kocuria sp.]MDO4918788.1 hypothetical protein [Kocuria sp.]